LAICGRRPDVARELIADDPGIEAFLNSEDIRPRLRVPNVTMLACLGNERLTT
jgi:hypothetical protein